MRKTYQIDTINAAKKTATFKQRAASTALKAYVIATVLAAYGGAMVYFGTQYEAAHADTVQVVKVASSPK